MRTSRRYEAELRSVRSESWSQAEVLPSLSLLHLELHLSLKRFMSVKRPQANSSLPSIQKFRVHSRSTNSRKKRTSGDLDWRLLDWWNVNLNQVEPLEFFGLKVSQSSSLLEKLFIFHVPGIATALSRSRVAKYSRR
jgi:hypothetical protein